MKSALSIWAIVICAIIFSACDSDKEENREFDENGISIAALQSFEIKYGSESNTVVWTQKKDYYVAWFLTPFMTKAEQVFETTAWFDVNGNEYQVCQRLNFPDLSHALRKIIADYVTTKYPGWMIADIEQVFRKDMGFIYALEIMNVQDKNTKKERREISYTSDGILLKDKWDQDENIYPVVISDKIKNVLGKLFPSPSKVVILEVVNIESMNEIEIDILVNDQHKEVVLNLLCDWLYTRQEISLDEAIRLMDPEVSKKLLDMASMAGIDLMNPAIQKQTEITVYDDQEKGRYFEVEFEQDNKELDLIIDKNGNIRFDN